MTSIHGRFALDSRLFNSVSTVNIGNLFSDATTNNWSSVCFPELFGVSKTIDFFRNIGSIRFTPSMASSSSKTLGNIAS